MPRTPIEAPDPPITTENLVLRLWGTSADDPDQLVAAWNDPTVAAGTAVPATADLETARRWIDGEPDRRRKGLALDLVIAERSSDRVLGEVGAVIVDASRGWAEVGWWLFPEARGRGDGAAAVRSFLEHLLDEMGIERAFARIPNTNTASHALAERAGMREAGMSDDHTHIWIRDRERR